MFSTIGLFHKFSYFCTNKALFAVGKFKDIWDTGKDGRNAEKRSFIRYAIVATTLFVRWVKAGFEIRSQERQIERYSTEIKEMDSQIHGLTSNRDSLERFARESFGFAEPGDDVYVVGK